MRGTLSMPCEAEGKITQCYFEEKCPKFDVFSNIFPRGCNFTDIDGFLELSDDSGKRHFAFLEFKSVGVRPKSGGQLVALERLVDAVDGVLWIVEGDSKTMEIVGWCIRYQGKWRQRTGDLEALRQSIRGWLIERGFPING